MGKFKEHFEEHKTVYIAVGTGVVVAGLTVVIMRDRHAAAQCAPDGPDKATMRSFFFFARNNTAPQTVINVLEREGRGHPGYIVRCIETNETFSSQREAGEVMGIYPTLISGQINGKFPDANGFHFERYAAYN